MAIIERSVIDQISADEFGNVSVRRRNEVVKNGQVLAFTYHRHVVGPGDDLAKEDERVQAIALAARKGATPLPKG